MRYANQIGANHHLSGTMAKKHNEHRSRLARLRRCSTKGRKSRMGRMGRMTTMAKTDTDNDEDSTELTDYDNMRAREVVSGLSPQQINPIKVHLASTETKTFVPAYSILFNNSKAQLNSNSGTPLGVVLEDGSEPKNNLAVVTTSGLVPLLCDKKQAKSFKWGDYVAVRKGGGMITFGYSSTAPKVACVFPSSRLIIENDKIIIGKFMGWPTNNPKDGGVLVNIKIEESEKQQYFAGNADEDLDALD